MEAIEFKRLDWLDYYLTEEKPGVYLLSNDGEFPLEIGRAEENLRKELKSRTEAIRGVDHKFSYFWFKYCENPYEAFCLHCQLWHRFRPNGEHPQSNGRKWQCPVCGL